MYRSITHTKATHTKAGKLWSPHMPHRPHTMQTCTIQRHNHIHLKLWYSRLLSCHTFATHYAILTDRTRSGMRPSDQNMSPSHSCPSCPPCPFPGSSSANRTTRPLPPARALACCCFACSRSLSCSICCCMYADGTAPWGMR